ncbi:MAG TPA: hypothetical protein ACYCDB_00465 [Candidatus Azoamicus sp.]
MMRFNIYGQLIDKDIGMETYMVTKKLAEDIENKRLFASIEIKHVKITHGPGPGSNVRYNPFKKSLKIFLSLFFYKVLRQKTGQSIIEKAYKEFYEMLNEYSIKLEKKNVKLKCNKN